MLAELLNIRPGVTAVTGGGGKTTLLGTLGEELSREGASVLLCTTTKIYPFPELPCARTEAELEELRSRHRLLCAGTPLPEGKLTAPAVPFSGLACRFDYVLVEADGAARRPLKAHAPHEPCVPAEAEQTILVVGASGFGCPIAQAAHRPELYARLAGKSPADPATAEAAARVILAEGLPERVYVNQVESSRALEEAGALAALLGCPLLAGSLRKGEYVPCSY